MPLTEEGFDSRSTEDIRTSNFDSIKEVKDNVNDKESAFIYALFHSVAETLAENQEQDIEDVYNAAYLDTATGRDLTLKARELGVERRDARSATGVVTFSREEPASTDFVIQEGEVVRTLGDDPLRYETTESVILSEGDTQVKANIRAVEGGVDGNIPANTISTMPSYPEGVDDVNNDEPIGDINYTDTDGNALQQGENREDDEELRERTFNTTSIGGAATATSIDSALRDLGVESVTIKTNPYNTEDEDGLSPFSTEIIVFGGSDQEVAETIYNSVSVTDLFRLENGIHGEAASYTINSDVLDQSIEVKWSRPARVVLDIDIDIIHDNNYQGDDSLRDMIVQYVGGNTTGGDQIIGTNVGTPVYIDKIKSNVTNSVNDETGVIGIADMTIDVDDDDSDDRIDDNNGLEIISIANNEVATIPDPATQINITKTNIDE